MLVVSAEPDPPHSLLLPDLGQVLSLLQASVSPSVRCLCDSEMRWNTSLGKGVLLLVRRLPWAVRGMVWLRPGPWPPASWSHLSLMAMVCSRPLLLLLPHTQWDLWELAAFLGMVSGSSRWEGPSD